MKIPVRMLVSASLLAMLATPAFAATFGTQVAVSALEPVALDGGDGAISASASGSGDFYSYMVDADYSGPTYLPVMHSLSTSSGTIDDQTTFAKATAYQSFVSSASQTITLDINLDALVSSSGDSASEQFTRAWAFISVWGGSTFQVSNNCSGQRLFDGLSICGTQYGFSSLEIHDADNISTLSDNLSFNVGNGETFGIYAFLTADSLDGSTDAYNTLTMSFTDDTNISVVNVPTAVPVPAAIWLFGSGLLGLVGMAGRTKSA